MDSPSPFLVDWQFVKEKKGIYIADYGKDVPSSFEGQTGTIVAVQAPQQVFGPTADQSDGAFVQYGDAIVRLDSGKTAETALYGTYLTRNPGDEPSDALTLVSVRDKHQKEGGSWPTGFKGSPCT